MQIAADAIIRNNIIIGAPVAFQRHQAGSPSNLEFVNNTVIVPGTAINVRDISGSVIIANNAVYSQSGRAINLVNGDLSQVTLVGNVGQGGLVGGSSGYIEGKGIANDFVNGHFGGLPIDLFPRPGSALIAAGDRVIAPAFDFNGSPRLVPHEAGAYAFRAAGNPGWVITKAFKGLRGKRPNPPVLHVE
jgi:hypothetical protein